MSENSFHAMLINMLLSTKIALIFFLSSVLSLLGTLSWMLTDGNIFITVLTVVLAIRFFYWIHNIFKNQENSGIDANGFDFFPSLSDGIWQDLIRFFLYLVITSICTIGCWVFTKGNIFLTVLAFCLIGNVGFRVYNPSLTLNMSALNRNIADIFFSLGIIFTCFMLAWLNTRGNLSLTLLISALLVCGFDRSFDYSSSLIRNIANAFSILAVGFSPLLWIYSWSNGNIFLLTLSFVFIVWIFHFVYVALNNVEDPDLGNDKKTRRENALKQASMYLKPYNDIWKNLTLSNKYCNLCLGEKSMLITGYEKVSPYRKFTIRVSTVYDYLDLWNLFCISFNNQKTYDDLVADCKKYKVYIVESLNSDCRNLQSTSHVEGVKEKSKEFKNLIDVNNASEVELASLPCINIVYAKKIVKKREEVGGFKSVEDFLIFIKLKPHAEKQLKLLVCVNKMRGRVKISKTAERNIDI
ncbi:MAG: hypothetical protein E7Z89_06290 [Cyanobacteria bacterium SIG28]|nr:hypothetical protein [Cyanobacteria bacterium SIG28]